MISLKTLLNNIGNEVHKLSTQAEQLVRYKKFRYVSKFNGQMIGRSKKPLTGNTATVRHIHIDPVGKVSVWDGNANHSYCSLDDIEFIE